MKRKYTKELQLYYQQTGQSTQHAPIKIHPATALQQTNRNSLDTNPFKYLSAIPSVSFGGGGGNAAGGGRGGAFDGRMHTMFAPQQNFKQVAGKVPHF